MSELLADEQQVLVNVAFTSNVRYAKTIAMPRKQWDEINAQLDKAEAESSREVELIHQELFDSLGFTASDVSDSEDPELDTFEESV